MRSYRPGSLLGLLVVLLVASPSVVHAQRDPESTVAKSLQVLSEITRNPKTGMPRLVMRNAQGIAIIPDMFKMSFVFGARFGRGVLVVRQPDGAWSNPVFIHLVGGSFGAQAGAQSTDLVLVFQTQRGLDRFLKGKGKLTLGVDAGVAAGQVGKRFEAGTDVALKSEILSYSNTRGLFAGVSAEGGTLQIDWRANNLYYRQPVSPGVILAVNSALAVPASTISLQQLLAEKTALPERVVRTRRPVGEPVIVDDDIPAFDDPDGLQVDGAIRAEPVPDAAPGRPRAAPRRESAPAARPGSAPAMSGAGEDEDDDDLDSLPPPPRRKNPPRTAPPRQANDEDLPEAVPGPAPARPGGESRPRPSAKPGPREAHDDEPELDAPRTSGGGTRQG